MSNSFWGLPQSSPVRWLRLSRTKRLLPAALLAFALALGTSSSAVAQDDPSQSLCANDNPVCQFGRCLEQCTGPIVDCQSNLEWVKCQAQCACTAFGQECGSDLDINCPSMREAGGRQNKAPQGKQDRFILDKILDKPLSSVALFLQVHELMKNKLACSKPDAPEICKYLCPEGRNHSQMSLPQALYSQLAHAAGIPCPGGNTPGGGLGGGR